MYSLIAFDMDGTLLNSKEEISERNIKAIRKAAAMGKVVAFCTGRSPDELKDYLSVVPEVRYAITDNGALIWDIKEQKRIDSTEIPGSLAAEALDCAEGFDYMLQFFNEKCMFEAGYEGRDFETHGLGEYYEMYTRIATWIPGMEQEFRNGRISPCKMSIHLSSYEDYLKVRKLIEEKQMPLDLKFSNAYSVEVTKLGVTKGEGLRKLCGYLGTCMKETIAVGDNDNDSDAVMAAGLGIAVGNAKDSLKKVADIIVADNDHDGAAEAIEKYLI